MAPSPPAAAPSVETDSFSHRFLIVKLIPGLHVQENRLQIGVGGDGFKEIRRGRRSAHIIGQDQAPRTDQWQELVEVIQIAGFIRVYEEDITGAPQTGDRFVGIAFRGISAYNRK